MRVKISSPFEGEETELYKNEEGQIISCDGSIDLFTIQLDNGLIVDAFFEEFEYVQEVC